MLLTKSSAIQNSTQDILSLENKVISATTIHPSLLRSIGLYIMTAFSFDGSECSRIFSLWKHPLLVLKVSQMMMKFTLWFSSRLIGVHYGAVSEAYCIRVNPQYHYILISLLQQYKNAKFPFLRLILICTIWLLFVLLLHLLLLFLLSHTNRNHCVISGFCLHCYFDAIIIIKYIFC